MTRLSKKNQKLVDEAIQEVREKPTKKVKKKKKRAPPGSVIPDNTWLEDEQQGWVFALEGMILGVDIDKETGIIKTVRMAYGEWKKKTMGSGSAKEEEPKKDSRGNKNKKL